MPANMKTFKIAKKTNEVVSTAPLEIISGGTSGNDLYVVVKKEDGLDLNEGGKLIFAKTASGNSGETLKVYEENTEIKKIVETTDESEDTFLFVYFEYIYIKPLTLASFRTITSAQEGEESEDENYKYKLYFTGNHHMLPCDLSEDYRVYVRRGEKVIEFSDLAFCFPGELVEGCDTIPSTTGCTNDDGRRFNFETMEKNSILAKSSAVTFGNGDVFKPAPGDQVLFATNPFFHIETETGNTGIGKIYLYPRETEETSWLDCNEKEKSCDKFGEAVTVLKYTDFMKLDIAVEQDYDAKRMFQEYQVNDLFVKKIKNSIIPNFIDLEKVKYAPAFSSTTGEEETFYLATGLTFNLHFRTRVSGATETEFEDTWHFNDDTKTWNGNGLGDIARTRDQLYYSEEFVNSSNLLGYLGFTDDDVYNQKNRLKQSFLRLSFYDSINPLEQNLLYFSTIFLDSGDLFGKYVKRKTWLEETIENYDQKTYPVVWSSAGTEDPCDAVTSQIIVNDEYDMTRSGEGFNFYLFREDAPADENDVQYIYMKVEFNHAGIGRTVPLIYWPKETEGNGAGKPIELTTKKYLENLYVKVGISFSEELGYVYFFPDAVSATDTWQGGRKNGIVWENERLVLNLFEPMIKPEENPVGGNQR